MTSGADSDGLPTRITAVRCRLGLSQAGFAARLGVTRNAVNRSETGKSRPSIEVLDRIAVQAGVTIERLLHGRSQRVAEAQRDKAWTEAVEALRAVWRDPRTRGTALSMRDAR